MIHLPHVVVAVVTTLLYASNLSHLSVSQYYFIHSSNMKLSWMLLFIALLVTMFSMAAAAPYGYWTFVFNGGPQYLRYEAPLPVVAEFKLDTPLNESQFL